jgi:signal transduction histidine kinase/tetratricopeptide (TPR) repeat protein
LLENLIKGLMKRTERIIFFTGLLALMVIFTLPLRAQPRGNTNQELQKRRDSLIAVIRQRPADDTVKAALYTSLAYSYMYTRMDTSILLLEQAKKIAGQYRNLRILSLINFRLGAIWHLSGQTERGIGTLKEARQQFAQLGNRAKELECLRILSNMSMLDGNHREAIGYSKDMVKAAFAAKDTVMAVLSYDFITSMHIALGEYAEALANQQVALDWSRRLKKKKLEGKVLLSLGNIYLRLSDEPKAEQHLRTALALSRETNFDQGAGEAAMALADMKMDKQPDTALRYALQGLEHFKRYKSEMALSHSYRVLTRIAVRQRQYTKAWEYNKAGIAASSQGIDSTSVFADANNKGRLLALLPAAFLAAEKEDTATRFTRAVTYHNNLLQYARRKGLRTWEADALEALSSTYEAMHRYNLALDAYRGYMEVKDSLTSEDKQMEAYRREMEYLFDKKADSLTFRQQLAEQQLLNARNLAVQREQKLLLSRREQDMQQLKFLQIQTQLHQENELQQATAYQARLKNDYAVAVKDKQIASQRVELKYNKIITWLAILGVAVLLAVVLLVVRNQRRTTRLNRIITQKNRELEQLNIVKNKLFSVVSHDMRSPLNSLRSVMSLLDTESLTQEELGQYTTLLRASLDNTSSMMDNLLNWAGSQMQGFRPLIQELPLHSLCTNVIDTLGMHLSAKQILIRNYISPLVRVQADRNMLQLVVRNLLSNAIKFSPGGSRVDLAAQSDAEGTVITITDQGMGMPPALAEAFNTGQTMIFESTPGTQNEKGTGLGLFLCKNFVQIMGGTISVQSTPGSGTVFFVQLPPAAA